MRYIRGFSIFRVMSLTSILHNQKLYNHLCKVYMSKNVRNITTNDALDDFTVRLMSEKTLKWNAKDSEMEILSTLLSKGIMKKSFIKNLKNIIELRDLNVEVKNFTIDQIDSLIRSALKENKLKEIEIILKQCIDYHCQISENMMFQLFSTYSNNGDIRMISLLQQLIKLTNTKLYENHAHFEYYLGIAHWKKGNIESALMTFENVYKSNNFLRKTIMNIFKLFIEDVIKNYSEASNVILKNHMVQYVETYSEHYPMMLFWEFCWLSEWFKDQQLAESLLDQYDFIIAYLDNKSAIISSMALKNHQEDAVMRLIQILLKHDKKYQCTLVMRNLFEYKLKMNDFRGCSEIVKNCELINIQLTSMQYNKYLSKFILTNKPMVQQETINKPTTFNLKF
ncbi:uncharacterized protein LOC143912316 [Arctopsyche grandis]|uniref:uncharacterized protein LOC143912316 n=1 Tax=Arctopsyche grandis TaxID=121162 RepID=UPI00406D6927